MVEKNLDENLNESVIEENEIIEDSVTEAVTNTSKESFDKESEEGTTDIDSEETSKTEDGEVETEEEDDTDDNKKLIHTLLPILGIVVLIAVVVIIVLRVNEWNKGIAYVIPPDTEVKLDTSDNVVLMPPSIMSPDTDDGKTTVLLLGNGAYYEGKKDGSDIVSMFSESLPEQVEVIDCTMPLTYLTSYNVYERSPEESPEDYFTLFWMSASICWEDFKRQRTALQYLDKDKYDIERYSEVIDMLENVKMEDIDVVMYCYDGYDYQTGRVAMDKWENGAPITENVTTLLGAVYTSIDLFSTYNETTQYIFVCPTFCYAIDDDGVKHPCDSYNTSNGTIAATFSAARSISNYYSVSYSYIDLFTGVDINEDNAEKYLEADGRTPNKEARRMIADRLSFLLKDRLYTEAKISKKPQIVDKIKSAVKKIIK